jgi:hypothetical protein
MKNLKITLAWAVVHLMTASAATAQTEMGGGPPGWNAAMTRLFGDVKAFSARADMRALDKSGKESVSMTMGFALLDEKVRLDIDMSQMKNAQMPPGAIEQLKQMRMDRMVVIVFPPKKSMYIIYPGLQAYVEMPVPAEEALGDKNVKIDKTWLSNETIEGHPCAKNKVFLTDDKGQKAEAIVWNAADLSEKEMTVVMRYKDIKLAKPEPRQFDAPAGYSKHTDMMQLMQLAAQKMAGSASAPAGGARKQ